MAMVLNAMAVDPRRVWKGPWRWYHEDLLDCCVDLEKVKAEGISRGALSCLALCNGLRPRIYCGSRSSVEEFRAVVQQAFQEGEEEEEEEMKPLVVQYSRRVLGQTGAGHFSPLGGYCQERDMVLVLDVARFKYPPYWVPLPLMWFV